MKLTSILSLITFTIFNKTSAQSIIKEVDTTIHPKLDKVALKSKSLVDNDSTIATTKNGFDVKTSSLDNMIYLNTNKLYTGKIATAKSDESIIYNMPIANANKKFKKNRVTPQLLADSLQIHP
jgi:hypothetical protein